MHVFNNGDHNGKPPPRGGVDPALGHSDEPPMVSDEIADRAIEWATVCNACAELPDDTPTVWQYLVDEGWKRTLCPPSLLPAFQADDGGPDAFAGVGLTHIDHVGKHDSQAELDVYGEPSRVLFVIRLIVLDQVELVIADGWAAMVRLLSELSPLLSFAAQAAD